MAMTLCGHSILKTHLVTHFSEPQWRCRDWFVIRPCGQICTPVLTVIAINTGQLLDTLFLPATGHKEYRGLRINFFVGCEPKQNFFEIEKLGVIVNRAIEPME